MQTFLPYADFDQSAACLDSKRLGKQRLEAKQILLALGIPVGLHMPGKRGWRNHPAVRMWQGHEEALAEYGASICLEWIRRGFADNLWDEFVALMPETPAKLPAWLGNAEFHASHRSNLLRKDYVFYGQFGWSEPNDLPYFWPIGLNHVTCLS